MRFPCIIAVLAALTVPLLAEQTDRSGWQYDAVMPDHLSDSSSPTAADINAINDLLAKLRDRRNAHDLEACLSLYWNSSQLMIVVGDQQIQGWQALRDSYRSGYPDSMIMGAMQYSRIQVKFSKPDLALAKTSWSIPSPNSSGDVLGDTTYNLQRFNDGWKIISAYSSFVKSTSRGWEYDSIEPKHSDNAPNPDQDDVKAVNDVMLKLLDRWNAHDIDGMMSAYWRSPQLLVVVQEEQVQGWDALYSQYKQGYPDTGAMGTMNPSRIQIRLVTSGFAVAQTWWIITYSNSKVRVVGNTTTNLQRFADGWKIVMAHSSVIEP